MPLTLLPATSPERRVRCIVIRKAVFVEEQGYTQLIEDNRPDDDIAIHFLLINGDDHAASLPDLSPLGTVRLFLQPPTTLNDTSRITTPPTTIYFISRLALLPQFRGNGTGAQFVRLLEEWIFEQVEVGRCVVSLDAQRGTYGFYEKIGYVRESEEFLKEEKIPHINMRKVLRE
ncbi:acyl-CoA N-acyltransferase [Favolaschia claudopus]|uniref:Acyl-CoA N-acyltransferase n=1 Tax=Favolaschia claudopus TaxID=2862362 RepID=A0AAW0EDD4_9AGAR